MKLIPKAIVCLLLFVALLMACDRQEKKPDYVWEKERFIEVLTEFQIAESIVRLRYHHFPDSIYADDSIYHAMYQKMEITEAEFDSNYHYYMRDPEEMEEIYQELITRLSKRSAELEKDNK